MPFQIDNQIFLQVLVNGYDMPIADGSFGEFSMNENVRNKLPTIQFTYNDPSNFCGGTAGLVGGSSLVVTFGSARAIDPDPGQTVTYLVTGINVKIQGTKEIWTVNGVYNAPTYLAGLAQGAYPGHSHEAIGALVGKCGLTLEADSGNDKMNWLPSRETYSDFIANIVDHAYAGASSIISHGVDDTGTLHVKDLQPLATSGATFTAFSGSPDQVKGNNIPMVGYEIISMDGLNNFTYNYGLKVVQEKLSGVANIIDNYVATQFSEFLSLSSSIQKAIGGDGVRSEYFPHDAGNCQVGDTLIASNKGLLRIKDIANLQTKPQKGKFWNIDLIVAGRYKPEKAAKWVYSGYQNTLKIHSLQGNMLHCTYMHPNLIYDPINAEFNWKVAKDCKIDDLLCINPKQVYRKERLELNLADARTDQYTKYKHIIKPKYMTPELAFIIASVIAEGCVSNKYVTFHNSNQNYINKYVSCMKKVFNVDANQSLSDEKGKKTSILNVNTKASKNCYRILCGSVVLSQYFYQLDVYNITSKHKYVPNTILQADYKSQLSFIAGYIEGDGSIDNKTGRISIYSQSKILLQEIQIMLNIFGLNPAIREMKTCNVLILAADESAKLWVMIEPYMITKKLEIKDRQNIKHGVCSKYWQNLIKERKIGYNQQVGTFFRTDTGNIINIKIIFSENPGLQNLFDQNTKFNYKDYEKGKYNTFLSILKQISKVGYEKFINVMELKYHFAPITMIEKSVYLPVYDLCMDEGVEPAFTANGLIIHNTHDNYAQAEYQNRRGKSLFSCRAEFTSVNCSGIHIYNVISFNPTVVSTNQVSTLWQGNYICTAKTKYISGKMYYAEKVEITSQGFGSNPGGSLVAG